MGFRKCSTSRVPRAICTTKHSSRCRHCLSVLGLNDVVLFGHSDGASIAIVFAAEHPGVVRGMVLEAPHLFVEDSR